MKTLVDVIFSKENNGSIIIRDDYRSLSKKELSILVSQCAFNLHDQGVRPNDRAALEASNTIEFVIHYFALQLLRVPVFPYDGANPIQILDDQFQSAAITKTVCIQDLSQLNPSKLINYNPKNKLDYIATLSLTSGTTGKKKLVEVSAKKEYLIGSHIAKHTGNDASSLELLLMPLSHSFGLGRLRACIAAGSSLFMNVDFKRALKVITTIDREKISGLGLVPTAYRYLRRVGGIRATNALSSLKYIEFGSASFTPEEKKAIQKSLPRTKVMMHYGMTEVSRALFLDIHRDPNDATAKIGTGAEVIIKASDVTNKNDSDRGLIYVRAAWQSEAIVTTSATRRENIIKSQQLRNVKNYINTGDIGYVKNDYLYVLGRNSFLMNIGGKKVLPEEVETILRQATDVEDVAIFSVEDDFQGEKIICYVVPRNLDFDMSSFTTYAARNLANHMVPSHYRVSYELPRSEAGKPLKNILIRDYKAND